MDTSLEIAVLRLALLCFAVAGGLVWLTIADRQSAVALTVVEWSARLPLPLYSLVALAGLVFALLHLKAWLGRSTAATPAARPARSRPVLRAVSGGGGALTFRDQVIRRARDLHLEAGARLELDAAVGVPFRLVLDQTPPGRAKRAISQVGAFIAGLPTPPRLQIVFQDCPPPQQPLHIFVQGALASVLPRGHFKPVSHADRIDVLFPDHDPIWREQW